MSTIPFSMRIDAITKKRLEQHAAGEDRSASYIAQTAIREYLDAQDYFSEEIAKAVVEADKGVFISEERMMAWFDTLGTPNELPSPEPDIFPKQTLVA